MTAPYTFRDQVDGLFKNLRMSYSATRKPYVVLTPFPFPFPFQDGHGDADVARDIISLCETIREHLLLPFCDLLARLKDSATKSLVPPVTCLVSDCAMTFTIQAAEELSLPIVLIQPASACSLLSGLHFRSLFYKGLVQLKDESCVDWIPGLKNFRLKDLPDFIRTTQIKITMVECFIESANNVHRASAVVINTSDELESDVLNAHTSMVPSLYPIGPFPSFLNQSPQKNHLASLGSNLWKEDTGVPMLCWPFYVDQPTNCGSVCNEWDIGIEIDTNELMVGEKGKKMRQKVMELKKRAEEDVHT
ncbi:7-deoxyloganetin glucosyltransferase [Glycine soja]